MIVCFDNTGQQVDYNALPHVKELNEKWARIITNVANEIIIPKYGKDLSITVYEGCFTSDEYGSEMWEFKKDGNAVCHLIIDRIFGEWKLIEGAYNHPH